jgi:hypothetical protein
LRETRRAAGWQGSPAELAERAGLPDEPRFTDEALQTVIGLLDGPGVVKVARPRCLWAN